MKRYIRTKDGIYENNGLMQSNSTTEENSIIVCGGHFAILVSKIIVQSDAIEDLCDEVVYVREGYDNTSENIHLFKKRNRSLLHEELTVYGAIWTDVGLIYVAKMNGKGEFELL